jgi:hypothetical protein
MYVALLVLWAVINIVAEGVCIMIACEGNLYFYSMRFTNLLEIYTEIDVNLFGAFMLALLYTIAFPVLAIQYWIYWLFTVGR